MAQRDKEKRKARGYENYMEEKIKKLDEQQKATKEGIFSGVRVYVNGDTRVPRRNLELQLNERGGVMVNYENLATHILARHLPLPKVEAYKRARKPNPVVTEEWITQSVLKEKRLPEVVFLLDDLRPQGNSLRGYCTSETATATATTAANSSSTGASAVVVHSSGGLGKEACKRSGREEERDGKVTQGPSMPTKKRARTAAAAATAETDSAHMVGAAVMANSSVPRAAGSPSKRDPSTPHKVPKPGCHGLCLKCPPKHRKKAVYGVKDGGPIWCEKHNDKEKGGIKMPVAEDAAPQSKRHNKHGSSSTREDQQAFIASYFNHSRLSYIGRWASHYHRTVREFLAAREQASPAAGGKDSRRLGKGSDRVVMHVDMDCFFVNVLLRDQPELAARPVAVAWKGNGESGYGEVSSCNYVARAKGVKANMQLGQANEKCPNLVVLRYDFEAYTQVSDQIYKIFFSHAPVVQGVSCDEAFLEFPKGTNAAVKAKEIRDAIYKTTRCTASAGASCNKILARIATKLAKPNGQVCLGQKEAEKVLSCLPVRELPKVGYQAAKKMEALGILTCQDLGKEGLEPLLQSTFGPVEGAYFNRAAKGKCDDPVEMRKPPKSVSATVNYGIRFKGEEDAKTFIEILSGELADRLKGVGFASKMTLSVLKAKPNAGKPWKPGGHGLCFKHTATGKLPQPTAEKERLNEEAQCLRLSHKLKHIKAEDMRGLGLECSLVVPPSKNSFLKQWLMPMEEEGHQNGGSDVQSISSSEDEEDYDVEMWDALGSEGEGEGEYSDHDALVEAGHEESLKAAAASASAGIKAGDPSKAKQGRADDDAVVVGVRNGAANASCRGANTGALGDNLKTYGHSQVRLSQEEVQRLLACMEPGPEKDELIANIKGYANSSSSRPGLSPPNSKRKPRNCKDARNTPRIDDLWKGKELEQQLPDDVPEEIRMFFDNLPKEMRLQWAALDKTKRQNCLQPLQAALTVNQANAARPAGPEAAKEVERKRPRGEGEPGGAGDGSTSKLKEKYTAEDDYPRVFELEHFDVVRPVLQGAQASMNHLISHSGTAQPKSELPLCSVLAASITVKAIRVL
ncbi:unnamed protein product, partial [Chrysoparadoxa australica]